jgi:hypothetical protein
MARRRHENGLKYQQRIQNEQQRANPDRSVEPDNRQPEPTPAAPVPPGVTQLFEGAAPPLLAPSDPNQP